MAALLRILAALASLPGIVIGWMQRRDDRRSGAEEQAQLQNRAELEARARIAESQVQRPDTEERLKNGSF